MRGARGAQGRAPAGENQRLLPRERGPASQVQQPGLVSGLQVSAPRALRVRPRAGREGQCSWSGGQPGARLGLRSARPTGRGLT